MNKFFRVLLTLIIMSGLFYNTAIISYAAPLDYMVEDIYVEDAFFMDEFKPDVYYYEVYLASYSLNLTIEPRLTNERFEFIIEGDDTINAEEDSGNLVSVTVSDPLGEFDTVTYELYIYVGLNAIDNVKWTGLTYLDVDNGIFAPQFSRYRITYYAILENNIDSFDAASITWQTINPDAVVEVTCRDELNPDGTLPEGKRTEYSLKVTEATGATKTYYLNLYRKAHITSPIKDTAVISTIRINGGAVPVTGISQHRYYYEISVPKSIKNLDIQAYPSDKSDMVQVFGPTAMAEDAPVLINLLVTSPSEDTFSIYTLRLEYDSFIHTERYTSFQLLMYLILAGILGLLAGFFMKDFILRILRWIKNKKDTTDEDNCNEANDVNEEIEHTEERDENGIESENIPIT